MQCLSELRLISVIVGTLFGPSVLYAGGIQTLQVIEVVASSEELAGVADSATQGTVTRQQIETRPLLRPGELLETVPGLIVTQHSGDGKANQYFLRGFNLDHGTDFATSLDDVPLNMPTNGHGQGYTDLNFIIPELVDNIQYRKGPYYADVGDFGSAGAARIHYARTLEQGAAEIGVGEYGYRRALLTDSPQMGSGHFLYALEAFHNDGPWVNPADYRKLNSVFSYSQGNEEDWFQVSAMLYKAEWNSTDQVPQRAIDSGLISRFGAIDPSDGGDTHRYSLSLNAQLQNDDDSITRASAYLVDYQLNLFSNFTYFLEDPVNGDQFQQSDRRTISGGSASRSWLQNWNGRFVEHTLGLQARNDNIPAVALYQTVQRQVIGTTRSDHVVQTSIGPYYDLAIQWSPTFRSVAGVRADYYHFDVDSNIPENSGKLDDTIVSPKLSLIFGPWQQTEYYTNFGYGFHSNDARGTTISVDPKTMTAVDKVDPLVRTKGAEVGLRTSIVPGLQSSLALWWLQSDSELLFVGDAGTTEASRPSRRTGVEWANYYQPTQWLVIDADFAVSSARFTDDDPAGNYIPGSIDQTASVGVVVDHPLYWFGGLRLRYFGPRPLTEDNSVRSQSSTLVNARVGYRLDHLWRVTFDVYNLFDREVSDIDYYYTSRLAGEPAAGVEGIHTHPAESRTARVSVSYNF